MTSNSTTAKALTTVTMAVRFCPTRSAGCGAITNCQKNSLRRHTMRIISSVAVLLLLCSATLAAQKNVVLIVTDDQGLVLGCYGNSVIKTPNIDRIAADGTRFTNAFCTTSSCSPSRSV